MIPRRQASPPHDAPAAPPRAAPDTATTVAPARRRLPSRRLTETRHVVHRTPDGRETPVSVSIGYDPADPARPREVFYDAGYRSGADLEFAVQDLCVVLSLLLQHGVSPREIGRSLSVSWGPDDAPHHGSLAGTVAAELLVPPAWAEAMEERVAEEEARHDQGDEHPREVRHG